MASNLAQKGKVSLARRAVFPLTLLLLAVAPSQSEIIINEIFPFDEVVDTDCTGPVHIEGTLHFQFKSEGSDKNSVHINIHGSGENLVTGATYQFSDTYNDQCDFEIDCPLDLMTATGTFDDRFVQTVKLLGQGSAPNLIMHVRGHFTGPPFTVTFEQLNVQCN